MAVYNLEKYTAADGLGFPLNFRRGNPNPLDNTYLYKSLAEAEAYASGDPVAYVGQILGVIDRTAHTASLYMIQNEEGALEPVGTITLGDDVTIVKNEDDTLSIKGFAEAAAGAQLVKGANGELTWVVPDATTVEGLQTTVGQLKTDVEALAGELDAAEEDILALENQFDNYFTKEETKSEIATQVAAADHLKRVKVDSVDAINELAPDADQYIYMVAITGAEGENRYDEYMVIDGIVERVGDWKVDLSDYATKAEVSAGVGELEAAIAEKVDAEEGKSLVSDDEIAKLATVAEGAEVNYIKAVDETNFEVDTEGKLVLKDIATSKVTGLDTVLAEKAIASEVNAALENKVNVENGKSLVADTEIEKLATVKANAEPNYIKAVTEEFTVVDNELAIAAVAMEKVTGLAEALEAKANAVDVAAELEKKVNAVEGSRLITETEAKKLDSLVIGEDGSVEVSGEVNAGKVQGLYDKVVEIVTGTGTGSYDDALKELLAIEKGAQANKLEAVKVNGVALEIVDKAVNLPIGAEALGLVKSSSEENKVAIAADGTMEVNSLNVNKLTQIDGEYLILNGGASSI